MIHGMRGPSRPLSQPSAAAELRIERAELLTQKFKRGLNAKEHARLEEIRNSLDDIEIARHGPDLDRLESIADEYEKFCKQLHVTKAYLDSMLEVK